MTEKPNPRPSQEEITPSPGEGPVRQGAVTGARRGVQRPNAVPAQGPLASAGDGAFQVGPGMAVKVEYQVTDEEGRSVESEEAELEFVYGFGQLLPRLEVALDAAVPGEVRSVRLAPDEAFGERDPSAVLEVDRSEFPEHLAEGDSLELENQTGGVLVMRVLHVDEDLVVLDANHPLAGQFVAYSLKVVSVRPATGDEMAEAERRALSGYTSGGNPPGALITPAQLVRTRVQGS